MAEYWPTGRGAFAPIIPIVAIGFVAYSIWSGEIQFLTASVRRNKSPGWYWFFLLTLIVLSALATMALLNPKVSFS